MEFPDKVVEEAWEKANGKCKCDRVSHFHHSGNVCNQTLIKSNRQREGSTSWEAHHKDGNTDNVAPSNCEIVCWPCHRFITARQQKIT